MKLTTSLTLLLAFLTTARTDDGPKNVQIDLEFIEVAEPVNDPRLGFTVSRSDGTLMVGHTIVLKGHLPVGSHRREYRIPSLPLVAGSYTVGTWLSNATGVEIDGCPLAYDLVVGPPLEGSHDFGTVSLAGTWS